MPVTLPETSEDLTRPRAPTTMPTLRLSVAVIPSTLTRVLRSRKTPDSYPLMEPFLTTMRSRSFPPSVIAEPAATHDGPMHAATHGKTTHGPEHVLVMACPCRSMVIWSAATSRQSPQVLRSLVSRYTVLNPLSVWQVEMFTTPPARARGAPASVVTMAMATTAMTRRLRWCMLVPP